MISSYHAHIYFNVEQYSEARELRRQIAGLFNLQVGAIHSKPVGPHSKPMFQVLIPLGELDKIIPWLMESRNDLSILIHGVSGDDLYDHSQLLIWMGDPLPLNLDALQ